MVDDEMYCVFNCGIGMVVIVLVVDVLVVIVYLKDVGEMVY